MYLMRRSRNLCEGGPGLTAIKHPWPFFSPQLILQFYRGIQWFIQKNTIIFHGFRGGTTFFPEGVQLFPGGRVQLFQGGGGGVQMLISIETHRT